MCCAWFSMTHGDDHDFSGAIHSQWEPRAHANRNKETVVADLIQASTAFVCKGHVGVGLVASCNLTTVGVP